MAQQPDATGRLGHFGFAHGTSTRRWVDAQAGRATSLQQANQYKEELGPANTPCRSTANQLQFRSFSAAEMRACRGEAVHRRTCHDPAVLHNCKSRKDGSGRWQRMSEHYPEYSSSAGSKLASRPATMDVADRPIPRRRFLASSAYRINDLQSHAARCRLKGSQDPNASRAYAPLPDHIVEHLVRTRVPHTGAFGGEDMRAPSVQSASTVAETSYPPSFRSESAPPSTAGGRSETSGMSDAMKRITGGIANRRRMATFKAPAMSEVDRDWFTQARIEDKGTLALQSGNFPPSLLNDSLRAYADRMSRVARLLPGRAGRNQDEPQRAPPPAPAPGTAAPPPADG